MVRIVAEERDGMTIPHRMIIFCDYERDKEIYDKIIELINNQPQCDNCKYFHRIGNYRDYIPPICDKKHDVLKCMYKYEFIDGKDCEDCEDYKRIGGCR